MFDNLKTISVSYKSSDRELVSTKIMMPYMSTLEDTVCLDTDYLPWTQMNVTSFETNDLYPQAKLLAILRGIDFGLVSEPVIVSINVNIPPSRYYEMRLTRDCVYMSIMNKTLVGYRVFPKIKK